MAIGCAAALTACAKSAPELVSREPSASGCTADGTADGSRAELKEEPDTVAVMLADVDRAGSLIGYGPSAGYVSELTLVDGVWRIAHPTSGDAVRVKTTPDPQAGALFLVTAAPRSWMTASLDSATKDIADLESRLSDIAAASPCPNAPLPFNLTGVITDADCSAVGRPTGAKGRLAKADNTLIGIFDTVGSDRDFMAGGKRLHVHLLSADGIVSGYLEIRRMAVPTGFEPVTSTFGG